MADPLLNLRQSLLWRVGRGRRRKRGGGTRKVAHEDGIATRGELGEAGRCRKGSLVKRAGRASRQSKGYREQTRGPEKGTGFVGIASAGLTRRSALRTCTTSGSGPRGGA